MLSNDKSLKMDYQIKPFCEKDTEKLYRLIEKVIGECYQTVYNEEILNYFLSYNQPQHILSDSRAGKTLLVYYNNEIIASGTILNSNIRRVFVLPEYQKNGIGGFIMTELEKEAQRQNLYFVELYAMMPAMGFYKKLGYEAIKTCYCISRENIQVPFERMGKIISTAIDLPTWNLNGKIFKVISNDGPEIEVNTNTIFSFEQKGNLVVGQYSGGLIKEGELIGYINHNNFYFSYQQTNLHGEQNSGRGCDIIELTNDGRLRLTDHWQWETKNGKGLCIMEERSM